MEGTGNFNSEFLLSEMPIVFNSLLNEEFDMLLFSFIILYNISPFMTMWNPQIEKSRIVTVEDPSISP